MNRLEKKCLIASAGLHGMLFLLLFVWPLLWVSKKQPISLPQLNFIPTRLIDGVMSGGGSPTARSLPPPAPVRPAQPQLVVAPPPPKPQTAPPKEEMKPDREEAEAPAKPRKKSPDPLPSDKKVPLAKPNENNDPDEVTVGNKKIHLNFTRATGKAKSATDSRAQPLVDTRAAQARYSAQVNRVLGVIGQGMSSSTSIDVPGPGGEAYADYRQFLILAYKSAWAPPAGVIDDKDTVKATVVVLRNGSVESFRVTGRSGKSALDESVERLKKISYIAPFPEGAQDEKRSFVIRFNLTPDQE
jgi:outer membrane biosynthesis protein TonB